MNQLKASGKRGHWQWIFTYNLYGISHITFHQLFQLRNRFRESTNGVNTNLKSYFKATFIWRIVSWRYLSCRIFMIHQDTKHSKIRTITTNVNLLFFLGLLMLFNLKWMSNLTVSRLKKNIYLSIGEWSSEPRSFW